MKELWIVQRGVRGGVGQWGWEGQRMRQTLYMYDCTTGVTQHHIQPEEGEFMLHFCTVCQNAFHCHVQRIRTNRKENAVYIHNDFMICASKWMEPENIMLSEISQFQNQTPSVSSDILMLIHSKGQGAREE